MRVAPYPKYKDCGVTWLGEIPEHWEVKRLKRLGVIRYGLGEPPEYVDDGIPFVRATDINRGKVDLDAVKRVRPDDIPWSRRPLLNLHEILVVRSGAYTGDSAIVTENVAGCIAGYDMVLTIRKAHPPFVAWVLLSKYMLQGQIYLERLRAAQPHLNAEELGGFIIILPLVDEQCSIADFLDRETARIDDLIAKKQRQIELLQEKRAAIISHAVTKGLNPDAKMKDSGIEWLGEIPEHWTSLQFRRVCRLNQGLQIAQADRFADPGPGRYEYITIKSIHAEDDHPKEYIENPPPNVICNRGDVLLARTGATGEVVFGQHGAFHNNFFKIAHNPTKMIMEFLVYYLNHPLIKQHLLMVAGTTTIPDLNHGDFYDTPCLLPPVDEQHHIVGWLDDQTKSITNATDRVRESLNLLKEYRSALISAAVTGKIDVRGEAAA